MKEKINNFFSKFISNDNTDTLNAEKSQNRKLYIFIGICILILLAIINLTDDGTAKKEKSEIGKFNISKEDREVATNWIGNASDDLKLAKSKISTLINQNKKLEEDLEYIKNILKNNNSSEQKSLPQSPQSNLQSVDPLKDLSKFSNLPNDKSLYTNYPKPDGLPAQSIIEDTSAIPKNKSIQPPHEDFTQNRYSFMENSLVYQNISPQAQEQEEELKKEKQIKHVISSGSITKAILLSGVDAPTMTQAKTNPLPILMKVVDTSILPNTWQYDIKDCFLIGEGYGDLTSERAYIRTNTLSCVLNNGEHIDTAFKGAITGEDGKIGLKGAVVTKQGALLARTLISGFLQGIGESFGKQDTATVTGASGVVSTPLAQTAKEGMKQGLFKGLSSGAEKLADFYLKMADQISPVIEISAGRVVNIITTEKLELKTLENMDKKEVI